MSESHWKENVAKLKAYFKQHGNFNIPADWKKDNTLSRWIANIRKHPNRLTAKQRGDLERIGFNFNVVADWDSMFQRLERFYEKYGHSYIPSNQKNLEDLFDWTVNQRRSKSLLTVGQIKKLDSVDFDWDALTDKDIQWKLMYRELVEFKRRHGHAKVPQDFKENPALGSWVAKQRRRKTEKALSREKVKLLNELGFLWKEDIARMREQSWENKYQQLVHYKRKHGHTDRLQVKRENYQLGLWMETQIVNQRSISIQRKKKLNAIGFRWERGNFSDERWSEMYEKLVAYKRKYGHCQVKQRQDFTLSVWVQRQKRQREKGELSNDRRKKLERIGIHWSHEYFREKWEANFQKLKEFQKRHGHIRVSKSDLQLFEWIQTQREFKAENRLSKEREDRLNKIGFIWKGETEKKKMAAWESMYKKFSALKQKYGANYALILKREYPALDKWVSRQIHNKEKLSKVKTEKLDAIGFPWKRGKEYRNTLWEEMYQQLVAYKKRYGHCDVPQKYPENQHLASWVNGQRSKKLSADKRDKLNKLGFSWAGEIKQKRWQQRVDEYLALKKKNKLHTLRAHMPLYSWRYQQRKNFQRLPREKKEVLLKLEIVHR